MTAVIGSSNSSRGGDSVDGVGFGIGTGIATPWRNVESLAERLASTLATRRIGPGDVVAIACCSQHSWGREVALRATERIGAIGLVITEEEFTMQPSCLKDLQPRALIGCAEAETAWAGAECSRMFTVGDWPGVTWWRAVSLQA
jgi:hypothetical protein